MGATPPRCRSWKGPRRTAPGGPWRLAAILGLGDRRRAHELAAGAPRSPEALRVLALTSPNGLALCREAVELLAGSPAMLERAHALVDLGCALRRHGRKREAREVLRDGMDVAHRCGATRLVTRARDELVAAGGRPRRPAHHGVDGLTRTERRVAELAAAGLSNREIGGELFVTINTVCAHLASIYRKLGISSRAQLRSPALRPPQERLVTFADILHRRAVDTPHDEAFSHGPDSLTYGQLDERARAVAGLLAGRDARGRTVLLLLEPGLDFVAAFFGCLYAGAIAVPAYPPARERDVPRLRAVAADAQAAVALAHASSLGTVDLGTGTAWLAIEDAREPVARPAEPTDPALLQYTPGANGDPRGVMVTHANLIHNSAAIHAALDYSPGATFVSCLAPHQDAGLVGGILQPVFGGVPAVLMSPVECLRSPLRWLRAISGVPGVVSAAPNYAYDLCVRKVAPDYRVGLNLAGWRVALNVAEPMCPDTMRRFADAFAVAGFDPDAIVPAYGLAEATLLVAGAQRFRCRSAALVRPRGARGRARRGRARRPSAARVRAPRGRPADRDRRPGDRAPAARWRDRRDLGRRPERRRRLLAAPGVERADVRGAARRRARHAVPAHGRPRLRARGELFVTGDAAHADYLEQAA